MFEFSWESLTNIFSHLYTFFMSIVYQFNKPFEDFFVVGEIYNVFDGTFYKVGLPGGPLNEFPEFLLRLVLAIFEPLLNIFGITLQAPAWVAFLVLIPALVIVVALVRTITNIINN